MGGDQEAQRWFFAGFLESLHPSFPFKVWRRLLLKMLSTDTKESVRLPTLNEIVSYEEEMERRYSMLSDVYCVADGLELHV